MRIKQLELIGFKSFRNKTTLSFPVGITAIVGPNGCGKSNVVDALRWVLGEQSAKHLRGQEMGDVVFSGNEASAPMGMAEVTLVLENGSDQIGTTTNGANGVAPANWTEVMISRRYFRSGESEYLFNKIPCRLRDIVEFFLGTGAGTKAYSMIEQGRVDHLINAKPEEIRLLVEEAAGVSLFRSRRIAAERKLERTQENLSRVADLLRELERQLGSLRRQAKKAEQYQAFQHELRTVDLTLQCQAYRTLAEELRTLTARRDELFEREVQLARDEQQLLAERAEATAELGRKKKRCMGRKSDAGLWKVRYSKESKESSFWRNKRNRTKHAPLPRKRRQAVLRKSVSKCKRNCRSSNKRASPRLNFYKKKNARCAPTNLKLVIYSVR